jgi:hypothetical protein
VKYHADAVQATMALNQTFEQMSPDQHIPINPRVKVAAGLQNHISTPTRASPNGTNSFILTEQSTTKMQKNMNAKQPPRVDLKITDDEVKRRTGFPSLSGLLSYVFIVCDGDYALILKQSSSLTWFEEWFMHLEYKLGRTLSRYWDAEKVYGPKHRVLMRVVASK